MARIFLATSIYMKERKALRSSLKQSCPYAILPCQLYKEVFLDSASLWFPFLSVVQYTLCPNPALRLTMNFLFQGVYVSAAPLGDASSAWHSGRAHQMSRRSSSPRSVLLPEACLIVLVLTALDRRTPLFGLFLLRGLNVDFCW